MIGAVKKILFFFSILIKFVTGDFKQEMLCDSEHHENQSVTQMLNNKCCMTVSLCQSVIQGVQQVMLCDCFTKIRQ
jgi:hypothetical protein